MSSKPVLMWYDYTTILIALEDYESRKVLERRSHNPQKSAYATKHIEELLPLRRKLIQLREIEQEHNCFQHGYINE